jgi:hypothetical protein
MIRHDFLLVSLHLAHRKQTGSKRSDVFDTIQTRFNGIPCIGDLKMSRYGNTKLMGSGAYFPYRANR